MDEDQTVSQESYVQDSIFTNLTFSGIYFNLWRSQFYASEVEVKNSSISKTVFGDSVVRIEYSNA